MDNTLILVAVITAIPTTITALGALMAHRIDQRTAAIAAKVEAVHTEIKTSNGETIAEIVERTAERHQRGEQ